uniref:uncharacterized protein LOC104265522 isoform X2 n=1 Tax=Ciona intestinalis TaxID=7719 RepID=UPI000EF49907|nr:uncharacterized protein LOC104265522 isoform X2 [Ciona intestinalis]|eukprot:XP_018672075.2 uncharacterized protein LOC104265522 isoform X2 [Ciona intestinalis]
MYSPEFLNAKKHSACGGKSLSYCIQQYQIYLSETGVGKRQQTSLSVAKSYGNQVRALIPDIETLQKPLKVYNNLKGKITGEGKDSTRYAYIATLLNFIKFYKVHEYRLVDPKKIDLLYMEAKDWEARQKKIKKKREFIVKEKSRKKIAGIQNAYEAILIYENSTECRRVRSLVNNSKIIKKNLELLYANLFCRVICKLGCRPSVFTGMTISELNQHEKTADNNYSILVKKQKDVQPACLVVNEMEFKDIKRISKVAWQYTEQKPSLESVVFPSLVGNGCSLSSPEFSRLFKLASSVVFNHTSLTATDIRKIIQTLVRDEPLNVQVAVAKASGHSVQVADQVYNVSHPHESVEKARRLLEERAVVKVSDGKTSELLVQEEDLGLTDKTLPLIDDTNNEIEFIRVRFEDDGEFVILYRTKDVRRIGSRVGVRFLSEIKTGDKCKARWPGDKQFYLATRVNMKEGASNFEGQSDSEFPNSPMNSPKKLRKLACKKSLLGSHTP